MMQLLKKVTLSLLVLSSHYCAEAMELKDSKPLAFDQDVETYQREFSNLLTEGSQNQAISMVFSGSDQKDATVTAIFDQKSFEACCYESEEKKGSLLTKLFTLLGTEQGIGTSKSHKIVLSGDTDIHYNTSANRMVLKALIIALENFLKLRREKVCQACTFIKNVKVVSLDGGDPISKTLGCLAKGNRSELLFPKTALISSCGLLNSALGLINQQPQGAIAMVQTSMKTCAVMAILVGGAVFLFLSNVCRNSEGITASPAKYHGMSFILSILFAGCFYKILAR